MARTHRNRRHFQNPTIKNTNKIGDRDVLGDWRHGGRRLGDRVVYDFDCGGIELSRARRMADKEAVRSALDEYEKDAEEDRLEFEAFMSGSY